MNKLISTFSRPNLKNFSFKNILLLIVFVTAMTGAKAQCNSHLVFTHSGSCLGSETLEIFHAESAAQITWYLDTTVVSTGTDSTYIPLVAGIYHVIVTGNICVDTTAGITVSPVVTPTVSISETPGDTICLNTEVTFHATSTFGGSNPQYQWKKNNVNVGNTATYIGTVLLDGDHIICVLTSNQVCTTSSKDTSNLIVMNVHSLPTVSVSGAHKVCSGDSILLTVSSATATSYIWSDSNTGASTYVSATGSYGVTVTDANSCSAASRPYSVLQTTIPQATITQMGNSLVTGPSQFYQWYFDGNVIDNATSSTVAIGHSGFYQVSVIDSNGCRSTSAVDTLVLASVSDIALISAMSVYPNPSTGSFAIDWSDATARDIRIIDALGNVMADDKAITDIHKQYDLNAVSAGIYYVQVSQGSLTKTMKLSIVK